eukprot:SAG31_NODE_1216_length_9328_cov_12.252465_9_plen_82_part_00
MPATIAQQHQSQVEEELSLDNYWCMRALHREMAEFGNCTALALPKIRAAPRAVSSTMWYRSIFDSSGDAKAHSYNLTVGAR